MGNTSNVVNSSDNRGGCPLSGVEAMTKKTVGPDRASVTLVLIALAIIGGVWIWAHR